MPFPRIRLHFGIYLLCALLGSCSTSSKRPKYRESPPWLKGAQKLEGQELKDYEKIQALYSKKSYSRMLKEARSFEKKYPKSKQIAHVFNLKGLVYLNRKKSLQAIHQFKKALQTNEESDVSHFLYYNLATAQSEARQHNQAKSSLSKLDPDQLDFHTRLKYHFLSSRIHYQRKLFQESARQILSSGYLFLSQPGTPSIPSKTRKKFESQLKRSLSKISDLSIHESLYEDFPDSAFADYLLYKLGMNSISEGKPGRADTYLRTLITRFPNTPHYSDAVHQLRSLQTQMMVDTRAIGVLVPMSGRFGKFGLQTLRGIELAFRIYNFNEPESKVSLVIEDSGETVDSALQALNNLYFDHHVVAVLGPLLSKGSEVVSRRAEELGIPLISLAQSDPGQGDFIFHGAVTPKQQAYSIARYAIQKKGLTQFAIVHPADNFGNENRDHFWNAVEELGGKIVGIESYPSKQRDFVQQIDLLSGLYYPDSRQRELDELKRLRQENAITRRTRKTEHFYRLPPIVKYEGVFIPDSAKVVSQVIRTFAYRDIEDVQFLGVGTWNSPVLAKNAEEFSEGSLFVDSFFASSQSPTVRRFLKKFEQTFGNKPTSLEALAYDAASILEKVLLSSRADTRAQIRDRLKEVEGLDGVTGKIRFENGTFTRDLKVLTIQKRKIIEANSKA